MSIIGILGRPNKMERKIISFPQSVIDVIIKANGNPLGIIPPNLDITSKLNDKEKIKLHELIDLCDGIILPGGVRDYEYDMEAVKYINAKNMPVLGICQGMQSLASATGGKIDNILNHKDINTNYVHTVTLDKTSKLFSIIGKDTFLVNSRHTEIVINPGLYKVVGYAPNKVIEAIEYPDKDFNIGIQWHPEDLIAIDNQARKLFEAFFNNCDKYHNKQNEKK